MAEKKSQELYLMTPLQSKQIFILWIFTEEGCQTLTLRVYVNDSFRFFSQ